MADFQGLVTLILTLDWVTLHTVMRHSSTFTYIRNFTEIEEPFCERTDGWTCRWTFETHFIRSTQRSQPNKNKATVDIRLHPRCAIPLLAIKRLSVLCTLLHGPVQFTIHRGVRHVGHVFSQKLPLPFGIITPT